MTDNNSTPPNDDGTATTAQGKRGPRKVRLRDEVLADLREDRAALDAKIAAIEADIAAEEQLKNLSTGSPISFVYGRAEKRRLESGTVIASGTNDKGLFQINVLVGEGINSTTKIIGGSNVVPPGVTGEDFLASFADAKSDEETPAT